MDYTKWKSVAVRKDKYDIIKALCDKKYRAPAAFIAKLVDEYITFQASKNKQTVEIYIKNLFIAQSKCGEIYLPAKFLLIKNFS
jgi:phosphoribosylformylglycinamidine (FGAM) synthase-like enzyme